MTTPVIYWKLSIPIFSLNNHEKKSLIVDLVKFIYLQLSPYSGIQTDRFFIHFNVAHKLISYTISYRSWMPVLDKKLQKYLFCLYMFSVSVLQHIVERSGCVVKVKWNNLSVKILYHWTRTDWGVKMNSGCSTVTHCRGCWCCRCIVRCLYDKMRIISNPFTVALLLHFKSSFLNFPDDLWVNINLVFFLWLQTIWQYIIINTRLVKSITNWWLKVAEMNALTCLNLFCCR